MSVIVASSSSTKSTRAPSSRPSNRKRRPRRSRLWRCPCWWRYRPTSTSSPRACLPVSRPRPRLQRSRPPRQSPQRRTPVASLRSIGGRAADFGRSLVDTFLRDNRLLPPILALLTLFVFAWVLAGVFVGASDDQKPVSHRAEFAQADDPAGSDPAAPEVDNPNVDSYAAYRSKDPFREIIAEAATTPEGTASAPAEQTTGGGGGNGGRPAGGGRGRGADTDGDGLPDRKEVIEGLDPNNPDTDGDGTPDGLDDADGDGLPDGVKGGPSADGGRNRPGGNGGGTGGRP